MSFLTSIAARAAGLAPAVEPRLPSRYEHEAGPALAEAEVEVEVEHVAAAERPVSPLPKEEPQPPAAADELRTHPTSSFDSVEEAPLRTLIETRHHETTHVIHEHEREYEHQTTREIVERRADLRSAVDGPPVHRPPHQPAMVQRETIVRPEVERLRTGGPRAEGTAPPTIRVTIGRVDVRAVTEPAPAKREPARRAVFTIEDYIRLRKEGRR